MLHDGITEKQTLSLTFMMLFIYSICLHGQSIKLDLRRYGLMLKRIQGPELSRLSKSTESFLLYSKRIKSKVSLEVKGKIIMDHITSSLPS